MKNLISSLLMVAAIGCGESTMQDPSANESPDAGLISPDASTPQHWRDYQHATDLDDEILDLEILSNGDVVVVGYERACETASIRTATPAGGWRS